MRLFFIFLCLSMCFCVSAQKVNTAITADGKTVILYSNGSWRYETSVKHLSDIVGVFVAKDTITDTQLVVDGVSSKLRKYFKYKNAVRCEFAIKSNNNSVFVIANWKVQTGEAFSYFGFINKKCKIIIELTDSSIVELNYDGLFEPREFEKYGFSTYNTKLKLSADNINKLSASSIKKLTMVWKKRSEVYGVKDTMYFVNVLSAINK